MGRGPQQGKGDVTQFNRDTAAQQPSIALAAAHAADLPKTVTGGFPWPTVTGSAALNQSAAPDTQRRERPGSPGALVPAGGQPRAARRRSPHLRPLRRGAVIAATTRGGSAPSEGLAAASGLTATPPDNRQRSAGRVAHARTVDHLAAPGAPRPADLPATAVDARALATVTRTTATAGALTTNFRLTKHLRANRSGPEGQLARTATGPTNSDHSSYSKGVN